ncbi:MAG TPA: hypothetical protein VGZ27_08870 [Vicinamibacterales bacterium]|jgi:hypothetical protein|nr:hypothetical protein [Vicinamibacterales bacterium]
MALPTRQSIRRDEPGDGIEGKQRMSAARWITAVAGLLLAHSLAAHITGQTPQPNQYDTYTQLGPGGANCGTMTKSLQTDRDKFRIAYLFWEQGFLTGANFTAFRAKQGDAHVGAGASSEVLFAPVEQYCGQHPERSIGDAVSVVYLQLTER